MKEKVGFPEIGKISPEFFDRYIYRKLGAKRDDVLVGPRHGVDVGIVKIGSGLVMAVTTDPIYIVPQYGWEKAAWFAWHILASDVTTSGFPPSHAVFDFNLPMGIREEEFEIVWDVIHRESEKYGTAVVAGHTARYTGTDYPMVGGATFMAVGPETEYLTPEMASPGDVIVITKGAAVEATGIFSHLFPATIGRELGEETLRKGQDLFYRMSTVDDALTAVEVGVREKGVTSLHDATECGVIGGIYEVAQASGTGVLIYRDEIPVDEAVEKIRRLFGMDPLISISEGTLIITVRPDKKGELLARLSDRGILAREVGVMLKREEGFWIESPGGREELEHPRIDPFWSAIDRAMREGLN